MGYAFVIGSCLVCKRQFTYNPVRVPSFRVDGVKEPICQSCIDFVNKKREEAGTKPFIIHPEAYKACDENELG